MILKAESQHLLGSMCRIVNTGAADREITAPDHNAKF